VRCLVVVAEAGTVMERDLLEVVGRVEWDFDVRRGAGRRRCGCGATGKLIVANGDAAGFRGRGGEAKGCDRARGAGPRRADVGGVLGEP